MNVKQMCRISLFAVFIAIGAFIKIPIGVVPITFQTLFVVLSALVLPRKEAMFALILYIGLGLCGIPVFASGCGPSYVLQPSFGFLIGFVIATYVMSCLKQNANVFWQLLLLTLIGMMIIYAMGIGYFYVLQRFVYGKVFTFGWMFYFLFLVYLPGDFISCLIAIGLNKHVKKAIQ